MRVCRRKYARSSTGAADISARAEDPHNENPTLDALGKNKNKAHPYEPESVRKDQPVEIIASNAAGLVSLASERTDGRWRGSLRSRRNGWPAGQWGQTDGRANRRTDGRTNGHRDGWTDGRTDGRMDGRTDGRTDGQTD